jgi:hypothetical protein
MRFCSIVVFCLLFPSCTKRQPIQQPDAIDQVSINNHNAILDTIIQQEAMLVDIPIPFYDERIIPSDYAIESQTLFFGYKSPLSQADAIDFFMNQMERYGWKHLVSFEGEGSVLQFESPDRYCTVIVKSSDHRPQGSSILLYIKRASVEFCQ